MGTPLTGQTPASTYTHLLKVTGGLSTSPQPVEDGAGTSSLFQLATNQVKIVPITGGPTYPFLLTNPSGGSAAGITSAGVISGSGGQLYGVPAASITGTLSLGFGGTGGSTASDARQNLQVPGISGGNTYYGPNIFWASVNTETPVSVRATGGQSADLFGGYDASGAKVFALTSGGQISGNGALVGGLSASNIATGTLPVARGGTARSVAVSSFTIAADQDNWSGASSPLLRVATTGGARNFSGMQPGFDGEQRIFYNVGPDNITLLYNSLLSSAANRFIMPVATGLVIPPNSGSTFWYDGSDQKWRQI